MKNTFYIIFLLFTFHSVAQNITEKTFSAKQITDINVNGDIMFKISVETKPIDEIKIYSRAEGENNESIILVTKVENNNLYIAAKLQPVFKDANDKLSAHKVISIEVILEIPENLNVFLNSNNAYVIVKGLYKNVAVNLDSGNCSFNAFHGNAKIDTREGNITMQTNHVNIITTSKNGYIKKEEIDSGTSQIVIKTINGNITVTRSQ